MFEIRVEQREKEALKIDLSHSSPQSKKNEIKVLLRVKKIRLKLFSEEEE